MSIVVRRSKQALAGKAKQHKKNLIHKVSMAALAASADDGLLPEMILEKRAIDTLKGAKKRARKSEADQIERIAKSIKASKQSMPILIDMTGRIIHGHLVAKALQSLGATEIWCAVVDHLDDDQQAFLHVALNRIGETGAWDIEALGPLLIELEDIGFDLETTGFTLPEINILTSPAESSDDLENEAPAEIPEAPVSRLGDLWLLGPHRLLCADATQPENYETVLNGAAVDAIFTDCPWNIPIAGFVSGLGQKKYSDFKMGAGEMSAQEFTAFCDGFHKLGADHLVDGGVFFSCIDWRSADVIMAAGRKASLRHINTAVWNKGSGGMGTPYRSAHEFVVIFVKGKKLAVNNVELGKHGRDRTNVWSYPGANRPGSSAAEALAYHPTGKPVPMVEDALKDVTKRGAIVLDCFMGSGTTLLAAERSKRCARGIELDPAYVDAAITRWEKLTGKAAIHAETGLSFTDLQAQREAQILEDKAA